MSPEAIAEICHEANRAMTRHTKDVPVQPAWDDAPEEMRKSSIAGVRWRLEHLDAPASAQHEEWMRAKLADGWAWGPVKDAAQLHHPALVPYDKLPDEVKAKDALFTAIVIALSAGDVWPLVVAVSRAGDESEVLNFTMPAEQYEVVKRAAAGAGLPVEQYMKRVVLRDVAMVIAGSARPPQRPLSKETLANWFTYHPPTEAQQPLYGAINAAQEAASLAVHSAPGNDDRAAAHNKINETLRDFVMVIDQCAPDSADKTAAIRCVRIARNAANNALMVRDAERTFMIDMALGELLKARWQANSAIACGGK